MSNPYEDAGRLRKVAALVAILQEYRITSDLAEVMDYHEWVALAARAHVKPPSDESKAAVTAELRRVEAVFRPASDTQVGRIPKEND